MKCPVIKCMASCCYNVPFPIGFIEEHNNKIVNPIIRVIQHTKKSEIGVTDEDWEKNKCPFLRSEKDNYRCNIYADRPRLCRDMGKIPSMKCPFLGQIIIH